MCTAVSTLADVVDLLMLHDRSAAAVVDGEGELVGIVTENDIMRAYSKGELPKACVGDWLRTDAAGLPEDALGAMTVQPSLSLMEAAALFREQASSLRHVLVRDDDGLLLGVLSSLDLARALCSSESQEGIASRLGNSTAADVMKPSAALVVCPPGATLREALERMDTSRQNSALVGDEGLSASSLVGMVTPRDALQAFVEHVPLSLEVGRWLNAVQNDWWLRTVERDASVQECAARMVDNSIHHLVVVSSDSVVGVLSSTDLARAVGSVERVIEGATPTED